MCNKGVPKTKKCILLKPGKFEPAVTNSARSTYKLMLILIGFVSHQGAKGGATTTARTTTRSETKTDNTGRGKNNLFLFSIHAFPHKLSDTR